MKGIELVDLREATYEGDNDEQGPRNLNFGTYQDEETGETMGMLVFSMDAEAKASNSGKTDVLCTAGSSCWLNGIGFKVNVLKTVPKDIREKRVIRARIENMKKKLAKLEND